MVTSQSRLWQVIRSKLSSDDWTHLQELYMRVGRVLEFDDEDLRPETDGASQKAWMRNVRNVLQQRRASGDLDWRGKALYRLSTDGKKSDTDHPAPEALNEGGRPHPELKPTERDSVDGLSVSPDVLIRELEIIRDLAHPMQPEWRNAYLAVFSCGVDGRVFRPTGVAHPSDRRSHEDLRDESALLAEISRRLLTVRSSGGRFFITNDGVYTWDGDAEELVRFIALPSSVGVAFDEDGSDQPREADPPSSATAEDEADTGSSGASAEGPTVDDFKRPYEIFKNDPLERLRVQVLRYRAADLRQRFSVHGKLDVDIFDHQVYPFEAQTTIDDRDLTGALFNPWISMSPGLIKELRSALSEGRATLRGNYMWGGDYRYSDSIEDDQERASEVRRLHRILGYISMPSHKKAEKLARFVDGVGPVSASGLVTICHPDASTIYYKTALGMMGVEVDSLAELSEATPHLVEELDAQDGLELARFLRLLQKGGFEMLLRRHGEQS